MSQSVTKSPSGESKEIRVERVNESIEDMQKRGGMALCAQIWNINELSKDLPNGAATDGSSSGGSAIKIEAETSGKIPSEVLIPDGMFVLVEEGAKEADKDKKQNEKSSREDK